MHFVAEEIRRRGLPVRHLHSWDDYDRFRKVPAGVDPSWAEHIGRPLSAVPDPDGLPRLLGRALQGAAASPPCARWAWRWRRCRRPRCTAPAPTASRSCTRSRSARRDRDGAWRASAPRPPARRRRRRGRAAEDTDRRCARALPLQALLPPVRPRHRRPSRPTTTTPPTWPTPARRARSPASPTSRTAGRGQAGVEGRLADALGLREGRLRARAASTTRPPGRRTPSARSSSRPIFDGRAPSFVGYSFVGVAGMAKMSSSEGGVPTAADALQILEAPMLRWLYVRRQPKQAFNDRLRARGRAALRRVGLADQQGRRPGQARRRRCSPGSGPPRPPRPASLPTPPVVVPFRLLSSVADVTAGSAELICRIVGHVGLSRTTRWPTSSRACRRR